jgi:Uma2 family endonuclease
MNTLTLNLQPVIKLTDEQFEQLATANRDLQLELTAKGELVIMPPTGGETGERNLEIEGQLWYWNRQTKLGKAFNSSTGFKLPNGATRSPDAAWIIQGRWDTLTLQERKKFPPLCPDFVVELLSETDEWTEGQAKMQEYLENGIRLGWLIDPKTKQVAIYRRDRDVEVLESPTTLSGEDVLPGFALNLQHIFN